MNLPGKKKKAEPAVPAPLSRLETRRDELRTKFSELQWDLGGAAYEMAARDYFRLDVLASMAAKLQVVDAELAEIERMARLERAGAAGSCAGCGSLYARGAVYCWRCGRSLSEGRGTIVGPAVTAPVVTAGTQTPPEPFIDPVKEQSGPPGRPPAEPQSPSPQAPPPRAQAPSPRTQQPPPGDPRHQPGPGPVIDQTPDPEPEIDDLYESGRPGYRPTPRSYQV